MLQRDEPDFMDGGRYQELRSGRNLALRSTHRRRGTFRFTVQLQDETGRVVGKSKPSDERNLSGGNQVFEEVFHLVRVPINTPGLYEFKLLGNHVELEGGTAYLRVLPG